MKWFVVFLTVFLSLGASAGVTLKSVERTEFSPARGEQTIFSVSADEAGDLVLRLVSGDGDIVRELMLQGAGAGIHEFKWDGRDQVGNVVPDEAYTPVAVLRRSGVADYVDDPRTHSGGEVITDLHVSAAPSGDISYTLPAPARVMVRVGVKGGAMLRSLATWVARPEGRNLQRWNGFDADGLIDLRNDRLAILVTAFRLPQFSVIATGNANFGYRDYRLSRGWSEDRTFPTDVPLERNGERLSRNYYFPRYKDRDPHIVVVLYDDKGRRISGDRQSVTGIIRVQVDIDEADRWLMEESLYEVAFFADGEFVSEEEHGYVPIGWIWDATSLKPGKHLLTVNVTGFTGKVGVKSIEFHR